MMENRNSIRLFYFLLFSLLFCCFCHKSSSQIFDSSSSSEEEENRDDNTNFARQRLLPSIEIVILVHPYNKVPYLPFSLGSLEFQNYPKDRLRIRLITERILIQESYYRDNSGSNDNGFSLTKSETDEESIFISNDSEDQLLLLDYRLQQNELTLEMLKRWTRQNRNLYNDIDLSISNRKLSDESSSSGFKNNAGAGGGSKDNYWTKERFKLIIDSKIQALTDSFSSWSDFVLFIDSDVILTDRNMFRNLTSLSRQNKLQDLLIVAPMLRSFGTYSNFWAGMDEKGYYRRTDDYLPMLYRKQRGTFQVPMIYSCFFIDLRRKASRYLTFDPLEVNQFEKNSMNKISYDDIIAFAKSASNNRVKLYVNNLYRWGYIPAPISSENLNEEDDENYDERQNLLELQLEALIDGGGGSEMEEQQFVPALSLESYVEPLYADDDPTLGVDQIYVINLERRRERRLRMERSLKLLSIKAMLWNATDGKLLTTEYLHKNGIRPLDGYVDPYHKRPMTFGEIGCFLSHFRIWQHAFRNNFTKILILEDDVRFERNFRHKFATIIEQFTNLDQSLDFLYIGRKLNGNYEDEEIIDRWFVRPNYSYWTIGYMLTRDGIRKLLQANPIGRMVPVDEFLPIMYGSHSNHSLMQQYQEDLHRPIDLLRAASLRELLIYPSHYVGDLDYISDTEDSDKILSVEESSGKNLSPEQSATVRLTPSVDDNDQEEEEKVVITDNGNDSHDGPLPPPLQTRSGSKFVNTHLEL